MKKKIVISKRNIVRTLGVVCAWSIPAVLYAQGLIPCGPGGTNTDACELSDLPILVNNLMNFAVLTLTVPLAMIAFAIGGGYIMFAPAKESNVAIGKSIIINTFWGMVFAFGSWVIVKFILTALGFQGAFSWVNLS